MEGQKGVVGWDDTHEGDMSLGRAGQDRTARVLNGDGGLAGAVEEARDVETEKHVERSMLEGEGGVEEALEIAAHSTMLCGGVSGLAAHGPLYTASSTRTTQTETATVVNPTTRRRQSSATACYRLGAKKTAQRRIICAGRGETV